MENRSATKKMGKELKLVQMQGSGRTTDTNMDKNTDTNKGMVMESKSVLGGVPSASKLMLGEVMLNKVMLKKVMLKNVMLKKASSISPS